jgi:hypothetical protein
LPVLKWYFDPFKDSLKHDITLKTIMKSGWNAKN